MRLYEACSKHQGRDDFTVQASYYDRQEAIIDMHTHYSPLGFELREYGDIEELRNAQTAQDICNYFGNYDVIDYVKEYRTNGKQWEKEARARKLLEHCIANPKNTEAFDKMFVILHEIEEVPAEEDDDESDN